MKFLHNNSIRDCCRTKGRSWQVQSDLRTKLFRYWNFNIPKSKLVSQSSISQLPTYPKNQCPNCGNSMLLIKWQKLKRKMQEKRSYNFKYCLSHQAWSRLRSHKEVNEIECPGTLTLHLTIKATSNTPKRNKNNDVQPQISSSDVRRWQANHVGQSKVIYNAYELLPKCMLHSHIALKQIMIYTCYYIYIYDWKYRVGNLINYLAQTKNLTKIEQDKWFGPSYIESQALKQDSYLWN